MKVTIYSKTTCPYCTKALELLRSKNVQLNIIKIDEHPEKRAEMEALSGRKTVPQIFINDKHVGGCDDLYALEEAGRLDPMLQA